MSRLRAKNIPDSALMFDAEYLWDLSAIRVNHAAHLHSGRLQHRVVKRENEVKNIFDI